MCGICNVVNCIRRNICGCGRNNRRDRSDNYYYNGYDRCSNNYYDNDYDSRRRQPRTNVICANQSDCGFEPCCDNDCACNRRLSNRCGCDD